MGLCFIQYIGNLELLARGYNKLKQTLLEVEYPLIEEELGAIEEQLKAATASLTWQDDCWAYIESVKMTTSELERRVQCTQDNVRAIQQMMRAWAEAPLLPRREHRRETAFVLEDKSDVFARKYKLIQEDGFRIHSLMEVITLQGLHMQGSFDFIWERAKILNLIRLDLAAEPRGASAMVL